MLGIVYTRKYTPIDARDRKELQCVILTMFLMCRSIEEIKDECEKIKKSSLVPSTCLVPSRGSGSVRSVIPSMNRRLNRARIVGKPRRRVLEHERRDHLVMLAIQLNQWHLKTKLRPRRKISHISVDWWLVYDIYNCDVLDTSHIILQHVTNITTTLCDLHHRFWSVPVLLGHTI
jgi:hypothetical protein